MSAELILFLILGILGIASAVGVIVNKSPITAAISLVVHFVTLAGLYLTLSAQFMAAIQVLVYAGAIMVLVVFVIMLLNLGSEEPIARAVTSRQSLGVGLTMLIGGFLIFALTRAAHSGQAPTERL